jgi:hypothetical protein
MTIDVKQLTTYKVSEDGQTITLSLVDAVGEPASLNFQISELGNLLMTLPNLIEAALKRKYRDASFRFTYPVGSWSVESATDPSALIITLRTTDGFGVSFSLARGNAEELGRSVSASALRPMAMTAH